ncbi:hypothetical protein Ciccas_003704 [Cichlidogyrus casuarinus]|uniref:U4/U6.U5 tri-snRNP-associated protein 1 n=1 Tax=Cichlidogyrus casuarinus TaxID=1844966 RepID=A0ABD2QDM2_9PLAT
MASKEKRNHPSRHDRSRSPHRRHSERKNHESSKKHDDVVENGDFHESLSIAETNKLRAKLGLAPLENEEVVRNDGKIKDEQYGDFYHKPAKNISGTRKEEQIKEKLKVQKEKREILDKLEKVKSLVSSSEDSSTTTWIERVKNKKKMREEAERKAKELEELDNEFGVSDLVKETASRRYDSADLTGIQIEHGLDRFQEGRSLIMTLKDSRVLEENEDTLVNVNLVDEEKYEKNRENIKRKQGFGNGPVEEDEDVLSGLKARGILDKYDEEGKKTIRLGSAGAYIADHERAMKELENELKYGGHSLGQTQLKLASDYFTEEEMQAKFKKRKKKSGLRSRKVVEVKSKPVKMELDLGEVEEDEPESGLDPKIENILALTSNNDEEIDSDEEWARMRAAAASDEEREDEFQCELEKTIARVRKAQNVQQEAPEEVAARLLNQNEIKLDPDQKKVDEKAVVFDYTEEFYKSISNRFRAQQEDKKKNLLSTSTKKRVKKESHDSDPDDDAVSIDDLDLKREELDAMDEDDEGHYQGQSVHAEMVMDEEPKLNCGLASAFQLAVKKGFVDKEKPKLSQPGSMSTVLKANNAVREDYRYDNIDAKFAKRDRPAGPLTEFREKSEYKPDIRLSYVDEFGRNMGAKEAFKMLSHKFHGRTSGKKKTEKRMKKIQEEIVSLP